MVWFILTLAKQELKSKKNSYVNLCDIEAPRSPASDNDASKSDISFGGNPEDNIKGLDNDAGSSLQNWM